MAISFLLHVVIAFHTSCSTLYEHSLTSLYIVLFLSGAVENFTEMYRLINIVSYCEILRISLGIVYE